MGVRLQLFYYYFTFTTGTPFPLRSYIQFVSILIDVEGAYTNSS